MARTILAKKTQRLLRLAIAKERGFLSPQLLDELLAVKFAMKGLSRRVFLQRAGIGLVAAPYLLNACKTMESTTAAEGGENPSVVVVGGGTAGLTAAYRLMRAGVTCSVYEGSDRFGGRMYTEYNFNNEGMFCERGGELVDSIHADLIGLCKEFGLEIEELDEGNDLLECMYVFDGKSRSEREIIEAFAPLAQAIIRDAAHLNVNGQIMVPTYNSRLAKNFDVQRLDNLPLSAYLDSVDMDRWLRQLIDTTYMSMIGGECAEQSSLNLLTLINPDTSEGFALYGESDESKRIKGGNENLPRALVKALKPQVPLIAEHRLLAIQDRGSSFNLVFDHGGQTVEVKADRVIIALPLIPLRSVDLSGVELSAVKRMAIKEWGYGTNSKLMLGFKSRAWRTGVHKSSGCVFGEFESQCFWETSAKQPGTSGIITNFLAGKRGKLTPPGQLQTALRDLDGVFSGASSVFDGTKLLQHWPSQPFTMASYTSVMPGQFTSIYGATAEPELGGRLVFAGEHCSVNFSGYMNGAVESGNIAAKHLLSQARVRGISG